MPIPMATRKIISSDRDISRDQKRKRISTTATFYRKPWWFGGGVTGYLRKGSSTL